MIIFKRKIEEINIGIWKKKLKGAKWKKRKKRNEEQNEIFEKQN